MAARISLFKKRFKTLAPQSITSYDAFKVRSDDGDLRGVFFRTTKVRAITLRRV